MSKLLYANLARLLKCRTFWEVEIFMAGYGVFVFAMGADNIRNGEIIPNSSWTIYFFNEMLCIGAVMAILTTFYLGVDYSDGTIRNKLIIGHTRKDIYLSNVFTCYIAGLIAFLTYSAVSFLAGSLFIGTSAYMGMTHMPVRVGYCIVIILAYAAIFSIVAMLDTNKARVAVVELLLVLAFIILMTQIWADLQEARMTSRAVVSENGEMEIEENVPNRKYVGGTKRVVYEWIDAFLPADQVMYVLEPEASFSVKAPICLLAESVLVVGTGMYIFGKKDIK